MKHSVSVFYCSDSKCLTNTTLLFFTFTSITNCELHVVTVKWKGTQND